MFEVLLAESYNPKKHDINNWILSEKFDGIRAVYDPQTKLFYSRHGNVFNVPDYFLEGLPNEVLDGELWIARNSFEKMGIIRRNDPDPDLWKEAGVKYILFDLPSRTNMVYKDRLKAIYKLKLPKHVVPIKTWIIDDVKSIPKILKEYEDNGAEGLIARDPESYYHSGRGHDILKIKNFSDAEAKVIGYQEGTGKYSGMIGSLIVQNEMGQFKLGSGLTDELRAPAGAPKIGSIVTFRYNGLTKNGIPRNPRFFSVRNYE